MLKGLFEGPAGGVVVAAQIASLVNEGLGRSTYPVDLGDGSALVVDPARIPTAQEAYAAERGHHIAYTADTHTHADDISGSPDLAAQGATFLAPAAAGLDRESRGLADGDVVDVGGYRLEAIATPGHTPDHLANLLSDDSGPAAAMCDKTERAMTDASVPERHGHRDVAVLRGGYNAWTAHNRATAVR